MPHETGPWPPGCCVAAFVAAALWCLGHAGVDRRRLVRSLGTSVGPDDPNPFALRTEPDPFRRGVPGDRVDEAVRRVLREYDVGLGFRRIRFCEVTLGLVEDVFTQATTRGCIMGVGLDFAPFVPQAGPLRHVCRLRPTVSAEEVILLDDCAGEPPSARTVTWGALLPHVYAVNDGFWCVGPRDRLQFAFAPPWDAPA